MTDPARVPPRSVLVTGASTPIGAALVSALVAAGTERVLAVGLEPAPPLPTHERVFYRRVDLTRHRSLHDLLFGIGRELGIEVIVHTALHRSARQRGPRAHRLDVEVTRELLELAEVHPTIRRFVYRSYGEVYRIDHDLPNLLDERHPLDLAAPARVIDRVEADLTVCSAMGMVPYSVVVLRCAEILAPDCGSQLDDFLRSAVCMRPLGFDPMLNLLSVADAVRAMQLAIVSSEEGVFNVPGADTLPLSRAIALAGRLDVPLPGPVLAPLYSLRARAIGMEFRYDLNHRRFHFSGVLDGRRARDVLGYEPRFGIDWARNERRSGAAFAALRLTPAD
jgi:UDP-glucose 4-epimerase